MRFHKKRTASCIYEDFVSLSTDMRKYTELRVGLILYKKSKS